MAPQALDQSEGEKVCGPDQSDKTKHDKGIVGLMKKISSQQISVQIKIKVMQRAVATCPKVDMGCGRKRIPSPLHSGSQVTLIHQNFFEQEIMPHIKPSDGEKAEALQLFQLTAANNRKTLIAQEPNKLLDTCLKTKLPGMVGWNLIKLAYEVFVQKYGVLCLENFDCPTRVSPLLFSQLFVFHHCKAGGFQSDSITLTTNGQQQVSKNRPKFYHQ